MDWNKMDRNHSWLRKHKLKHVILSPFTFESDQHALSITFKQQEMEEGKGKEDRVIKGGKQREGDNREWMIRFQLWSAAVGGSGG